MKDETLVRVKDIATMMVLYVEYREIGKADTVEGAQASVTAGILARAIIDAVINESPEVAKDMFKPETIVALIGEDGHLPLKWKAPQKKDAKEKDNEPDR